VDDLITIGIDIFIDGVGENDASRFKRSISDKKMTKESLAAKPIKYVLNDS